MYLVPNDLQSTAIPAFDNVSRDESYPELGVYHCFCRICGTGCTGNSTSGAPVEPLKKLEHLKQRVRSDVITSMKSCLRRNPKEKATIPELLNYDWLAMKVGKFIRCVCGV